MENLVALIQGYTQIHTAGLLVPIINKSGLAKLTQYLASNLFEKHTQYSPVQVL